MFNSYCMIRRQLAQHSVGVLRIEVKDSGAGIALEDQSKMFGQFTQFSRNELQNGGETHSLSIQL